MNTLWLDVRYAVRRLRQSPGFTLTAVLTLAFGIGATTAIFSIVEGVLLRPLPFSAPDRLVVLGDVPEGVPFGSGTPNVTAPATRAYARDTHVFEAAGAYQQTSFELSGSGDPAQIFASRLTPTVFQVLGVSPVVGRVFTEQEDEGRQQVAVISYQMWNSRFHADTGVLGTKILLDRKAYEIVGVMPRDFEFPLVPGQLNRSELWVPMSFTQGELVNGAGSWNYTMVGRMKPGVTLAQAVADMQPAAQEIMRGFPPGMGTLRIHPVVQSLNEATVSQARPLVRTLFLAVAVVLFIACANLAGLLLVRVIRRRRELSVRLALGASGAIILRQSLIEALVLSVGGGMVGLAIAAALLKVGVSLLPESLPRVSAIALDWKVAGFALLAGTRHRAVVRNHPGYFCGAYQRERRSERGWADRYGRRRPGAAAFDPGDRGTRSGAGAADCFRAAAAQFSEDTLGGPGLSHRPRSHCFVWAAAPAILFTGCGRCVQRNNVEQARTVAGRAGSGCYRPAAQRRRGQ